MFDSQKLKKDFPILAQLINGKPLVYLDNAATSQKPRAVVGAVSRYYEEINSNIHRGIHTLAERATAAYEETRGKAAKFVGAATEEIVFTSGTTEGINLVAQALGKGYLKAGDNVLLTLMEHHSNIVPWQLLVQDIGINLEFIPVTQEGFLEETEKAISRVKPKLLSFTHVSNVLGTINPVRELIRFAKTLDPKPYVLVDGAQAVPHLPVNVSSLGADFYAFSAHKMLGPTGVGALFIRRDVAKSLPPFHGGGEMIREVHLKESLYKDPPYRFEAGTPNIAGVVGFGAAFDYLSELGMDAVREHEDALTAYALERLSAVEGLTVYGPPSAEERGGVVSFSVEGMHPHDLATVLDQEGVAIRSGHHCAMPLHSHLGLVATARASFYLYNTREDVDRLIEALEGARKVLS